MSLCCLGQIRYVFYRLPLYYLQFFQTFTLKNGKKTLPTLNNLSAMSGIFNIIVHEPGVSGVMDACHELFCIFGDFYASRMQEVEVTKSLSLHMHFPHSD